MSNKKEISDLEAGDRCRDDRREDAFGSFGSATGEAASAGASSQLLPDTATENSSELVGGGEESSTPMSSTAAATNGIHDTTKLRVKVADAPPTVPESTKSTATSAAASSPDQRPTLQRSAPPQRHLLPVVPTNEVEMLHVHTVHGEKSWQAALLKFLHSNPVQFTLMALLLLDVCVLFVELFIDAAFPNCGIVVRDAISCCPATNSSASHSGSGGEGDGGGGHRLLAGDGHDDGHHGVCVAPLVDSPQYEAGCDSHKYPALHPTHVALFSITISILGIFLIELSLLMAAIGPRVFFRHFFYVLDLVIVTVSMALELTFKFLHDDALAALTGILVLSRVWRFVRIGHGLIEVTVEATSHQRKDVLKYVEELEALLRENGISLPPSRHKKELKESLSKTMLGES